jgi:hypothetical protein
VKRSLYFYSAGWVGIGAQQGRQAISKKFPRSWTEFHQRIQDRSLADLCQTGGQKTTSGTLIKIQQVRADCNAEMPSIIRLECSVR